MSAALWVLDTKQPPPAPQSDYPPVLYANQLNDDLTHTFTSAIGNAKKSVLLIVFSLTDPNIIQCLKEKCQQGIDVKVICDAKASPYIDSKLGCNVDVVRRFGMGLMHIKFWWSTTKKLGSAQPT